MDLKSRREVHTFLAVIFQTFILLYYVTNQSLTFFYSVKCHCISRIQYFWSIAFSDVSATVSKKTVLHIISSFVSCVPSFLAFISLLVRHKKTEDRAEI
jgi:hypothetical protein